MPPSLTKYPYHELTFDEHGGFVPSPQSDALSTIGSAGFTDVFVCAHGWNNDGAEARTLIERLFDKLWTITEMPEHKRSGTKIGVVGVLWPSKRWADDPVIPREAKTASVHGPAPVPSDGELVRGLRDVFTAPAQRQALEKMATLLDTRPADKAELIRFHGLMAAVATEDDAADAPEDNGEAAGLIGATPEEVFGRFAALVPQKQAGAVSMRNPFARLWSGAKEALRQATYYEMKKRAGVVGRSGLGPFIGNLRQKQPSLRMHLVGHSFGARLVSFALSGMPDKLEGTASPVKSVVLLQGAFSHFAFATALPHDHKRGGVLAGLARRVDGPLVVTHSRKDLAVSTFYPRASFAHGDDAAAAVGRLFRWSAMGCDGAQAVDASSAKLGPVGTAYPFAPGRFTNLDGNAVITKGRFPSGAHSDIFYPQIAWALLQAAGLVSSQPPSRAARRGRR